MTHGQSLQCPAGCSTPGCPQKPCRSRPVYPRQQVHYNLLASPCGARAEPSDPHCPQVPILRQLTDPSDRPHPERGLPPPSGWGEEREMQPQRVSRPGAHQHLGPPGCGQSSLRCPCPGHASLTRCLLSLQVTATGQRLPTAVRTWTSQSGFLVHQSLQFRAGSWFLEWVAKHRALTLHHSASQLERSWWDPGHTGPRHRLAESTCRCPLLPLPAASSPYLPQGLQQRPILT